MKRIFAFLLALVLLVGCVPMTSVYAAETEATENSELTLTQVETASDPGTPDNEELFAAYAETLFYGSSPSFFGTAAGARLSGDEKVLYDALVPYIKQIAAGERESTIIGIGQTVEYEGVTYTPDVAATFTGASLSEASLGAIMGALLADLPYELYWYDKVTGVTAPYLRGATIVYIQFEFPVADNYSAGSDYVADTAKTGLAAAAAANAQNIVSKYADKTDYEKLLGYKEEICALVSYDRAAADDGDFSLDNDPWQLIHVFDGDTTTNVVCEGYSKAFMYLCDLTTFRGDVSCYTVTGEMNGGGHMWNIVTLAGKSYLVDVTNSDSGTVGQDGRFFLAGTAGSATSGYTIGTTTFVYDAETTGIWGTDADSILTLAAENYTPGEDPCADGHVGETEVRGAAAATCTAEGYTGDTYCLTCGNMTTSGTTIPKTAHSYTAVVTAPTCSKEGYTTYTCSCGDTYTGDETPVVDHTYVDGKCKWCQAEAPYVPFKLVGANMTLGNDLAMNFMVNKTDIDNVDDYYVKITKTYADGRDDVVVESKLTSYNSKYYSVKFNGISAKEMNDKIYVQVFNNDGTAASEVYEDSIVGYTMRAMDKQDGYSKTLMVDMLNYGAAAQTEFDYDASDLANSRMSAEQKACATQNTIVKDYRVKGTNYHGTNLSLKSNLLLNFFFKNITPDMYAIVTFTKHTGESKNVRVEGSEFIKFNSTTYKIPVDELVIADARQLVTCKVYKADGTLVANATDSVESYVARALEKDGENPLYETIMKLADSAYAYLHNR